MNTREKQKSLAGRIAPLFVLSAASLWGLLGFFVRRLSVYGFTNRQTVMCRAFVVAVTLIGYLLVFERSKLKIQWKDIWMFLGTGILSIVFFNMSYFYTIQEMSLSAACIFLYTAPGFVMLLSAVIFKEKINMKKVISLILAFSGCVCVSGMIGGETKISTIGILAGLASGFCYCLYSIFGKFAAEKYASETITAYTFLIAFFAMIPFGKPIETVEIALVNREVFLLLFLLGVFLSFLPYFLYTIGLKYIEPGKASIMASVEPMVATMCGIFVYHEELTVMNAMGILLIFLSVIVVNVGEKEEYRR